MGESCWMTVHLIVTISELLLQRLRVPGTILIVIIFPPVLLLLDVDLPDAVADFTFGLLGISYMFLDALFLYVPLVNEDTKCVMLDNRLKIEAIVLRSLGDFRYVQRIYLRIKRGLRESHSLKKIAMSVANDTVCILPVPQGLRNLSSFASNLNSSTYGWENLFVVVISISGLVLFMYLLGHSQTYMQETDRRESVKRKMKMIIKPKIQSLLSEYGLSSEMEWYIKRVVKLILEKDEDFIVENMFSILSFNLPDERQGYKEFLDSEIKCELFLDKLKKVERLKDRHPEVLKNICQHLEPMIYTEGSYIIRQGEPLDMMFFVTQGIVLTYETNNGGSSSSGTIQLIKKAKDSLYGQELLTLAEGPSKELSTLPISPFTVKSHKKVEVFALKAIDLQKVFSEVPSHRSTSDMEIVSE